MFTLRLNKESAAVLLHCLSYGQAAVSQADQISGVAKVIEENCNLIRDQLAKEIATQIIHQAADADEE